MMIVQVEFVKNTELELEKIVATIQVILMLWLD
jgi:hypothetical protein